jgi:hypothetical protein
MLPRAIVLEGLPCRLQLKEAMKEMSCVKNVYIFIYIILLLLVF